MPKARSFFGIFRATPQQRARRFCDIQAIHQLRRSPLAKNKLGAAGVANCTSPANKEPVGADE